MSASTNSWSLEAHDAEVRLERGERDSRRSSAWPRSPPRSASTCPRWGTRRARRRRAASARAAASAPRRTRPARRSSAPAGRSTGSGRCRARPARRGPRASGRRGARGRRAARRRGSRTDGALGHVDHEVGAARAVALLARPVRARLGPAVRVVAEREQRRDVAVGLQPDVAARAAVAAVGPALRDVGLAPERHAARAAVAAAEVDLDLVDERRTRRSAYGRRRAARRSSSAAVVPTRVRTGRCRRACGPAVAELHDAVRRGEQRVVAALADVLAGVEPGAALAHDDRARVRPRCRCRPSRRAAGRWSHDRCGRRPRPSSSTSAQLLLLAARGVMPMISMIE